MILSQVIELKSYLDKIPTWVCVAVPATAAYYGYLKYKSGRLNRKGFPGPRGNVLLGCSSDLFSKGLIKFNGDLIREYGPVVGVPLSPSASVITVSDLDIIRDICIKEFTTFSNHTPQAANEAPPLRKMLLALKNDHWRHVRNTLSPTFSGGKLRRMTEAINKCCKAWNNILEQKREKGEVLEMKEFAGYLTMDMIASTVFGLDVESASDPNNEFVKHANAIMAVSREFNWRFRLYMIFGKLLAKLGFTVFPKDSMRFFEKATEQAIQFRDDKSTKKDFIKILVDSDIGEPKEKDMKGNEDLAKDEDGYIYSKTGLTREEVIANALIFFLAGFDTLSTAVCFLCYNLARHPDIQAKLYEEIVDVIGDQDPDYDILKKMPYLEMCVEESLRMYPPAAATDRYCNEDVTIRGYHFEKGQAVFVAVWDIHYNPEIYPNPEQFIPERFTPEEKAARHPMAWLPFGQGPRNCIAMRLAMMKVKLSIVNLLKEFRLVTCDQTQYPPTILKFRMEAEEGLNLKVEKRQI